MSSRLIRRKESTPSDHPAIRAQYDKIESLSTTKGRNRSFRKKSQGKLQGDADWRKINLSVEKDVSEKNHERKRKREGDADKIVEKKKRSETGKGQRENNIEVKKRGRHWLFVGNSGENMSDES